MTKFFLNAIIKKKPWQFHKATFNVLSHLSKIKFRSELNGTGKHLLTSRQIRD